MNEVSHKLEEAEASYQGSPDLWADPLSGLTHVVVSAGACRRWTHSLRLQRVWKPCGRYIRSCSLSPPHVSFPQLLPSSTAKMCPSLFMQTLIFNDGNNHAGETQSEQLEKTSLSPNQRAAVWWGCVAVKDHDACALLSPYGSIKCPPINACDCCC